MNKTQQLSVGMQTVAARIDGTLSELAGAEVPWVLVCQVDGVAQYVGNVRREDGTALIRSLLERWDAGRADIPAHYNPDLNRT